MLKLMLTKEEERITINSDVKKFFMKPLIYYTVNNLDESQFFVSFNIFDIKQEKLIILKTFMSSNMKKVNKSKDKDIYILHRTPHKSISIRENIDFYTFVQDEPFFYYVNYKENYVIVYTLNDFIPSSQYKIVKLGATFYKDNNTIIIGGVDQNSVLHIFKAKVNDLYCIKEIFSIPNMDTPPHCLRKYKNVVLMSHDFETAYFYSKISKKIISSKALALDLQRKYIRLKSKVDNFQKIIDDVIKEKGLICEPGKIMTVSSNIINEYKTTGTSPAHFEIDNMNDDIYVSSHNFFVYNGKNVYVEPAVIDKFHLDNGKLIHVGTFNDSTGYRFTSHKFFRKEGKPYLAVFGQPNRLFIVDGETMKAISVKDIENCELKMNTDIRKYLNARDSNFEIVPLEVSDEGKYLVFLSDQYLYFYNIKKGEVLQKISCLPKLEKLKTAHIDNLV